MSANMKMSIDCEIIYKLNEKKILKYNIQMVKLEDYTITELKKMISSFNKIVKFSAYSKLKKSDLIKMIRTHPKVKVEEGSNAVKLSIKTDEDFEKQTKVKKEKVKKEVKKEVEKLDDVKVVVKPEPKKKIKFNITKKAEPDKKITFEEFKFMPLKEANKLGEKTIKRIFNEYTKKTIEEIKKLNPSTRKEHARLQKIYPNEVIRGNFEAMPFEQKEAIISAFEKVKIPKKEKVIQTQEDKTYDAIDKLSKFLNNILPDEDKKITKASQLKELKKYLKDNKKEYADFLSRSKFNPSKYLTSFRNNYTDYSANYSDEIRMDLLELYEKDFENWDINK